MMLIQQTQQSKKQQIEREGAEGDDRYRYFSTDFSGVCVSDR